MVQFRATTIVAVRRGDDVCIAGSVADAFALREKFEAKLEEHGGNLKRAAVALAQMWRSDRGMRNLEALMLVADKDATLLLSGNGEVIEPDENFVAIGGGQCAVSSHRSLRRGDLPRGAEDRIFDLRLHQRPHQCRETVRRA